MKFQTGPIPVRKILGPYWTKPGPVQSRLVHPRTGENTVCIGIFDQSAVINPTKNILTYVLLLAHSFTLVIRISGPFLQLSLPYGELRQVLLTIFAIKILGGGYGRFIDHSCVATLRQAYHSNYQIPIIPITPST